jgi:hypothetical protein
VTKQTKSRKSKASIFVIYFFWQRQSKQNQLTRGAVLSHKIRTGQRLIRQSLTLVVCWVVWEIEVPYPWQKSRGTGSAGMVQSDVNFGRGEQMDPNLDPARRFAI